MHVRRQQGIILLLVAGAIALGCSDKESATGSADSATSSTAGSGGGATASSSSGATSGSSSGSSAAATTGSSAAATTGSGGASTTGSGGASTTGSSATTTAASTGTFMGSPCSGNLCDIQFDGADFTPHDGQLLRAGIIPQGSMGFDWQDSATVTAGAFSMQGTAVLQKGVSYFLNYYADIDGDGKCEPGTDHIWRISIPAVQNHLIITVAHNTNFSNLGCGGF